MEDTLTTAQDELAYASAVEALHGLHVGRSTAADLQARGWSTYQLCLLEMAFGHPGDVWRSMSLEQRTALRIHAPVVAKAAEERASRRTGRRDRE